MLFVLLLWMEQKVLFVERCVSIWARPSEYLLDQKPLVVSSTLSENPLMKEAPLAQNSELCVVSYNHKNIKTCFFFCVHSSANIHAEAPDFEEMSTNQEILVTGIKVVDLLAPYAKGGKIGERFRLFFWLRAIVKVLC